jgi:hypothetical protein
VAVRRPQTDPGNRRNLKGTPKNTKPVKLISRPDSLWGRPLVSFRLTDGYRPPQRDPGDL